MADDIKVDVSFTEKSLRAVRSDMERTLGNLNISIDNKTLSGISQLIKEKVKPKLTVTPNLSSIANFRKDIQSKLDAMKPVTVRVDANVSNLAEIRDLQRIADRAQSRTTTKASTDGISSSRLSVKDIIAADKAIDSIVNNLGRASIEKDRFAQNVASKFPKISADIKGSSDALEDLSGRIQKLKKDVNTVPGLEKQIENKENRQVPRQRSSESRLDQSRGRTSRNANRTIDQENKLTDARRRHVSATQAAADAEDGFARRLGITTNRLAAYVAASAGFFAIFRAVDTARDSIINIDASLNKLQQITQENKESVAELGNEVLATASKYGQSGQALLDTAQTIAQAGSKFYGRQGILEATDALAKTELAATFTDLESTTDGLIAALSQFNMEASKSNEILDVANQLSKRFAAESGDIFTAVKTGGAAFATAGGDFEEFAATVTAIRQLTRLSPSAIGAGLNTIALRTLRPESVAFIEELTGGGIRDAQGNLKGIVDIWREIAYATRSYNEEQLQPVIEQLAGIRQGKIFTRLLQDLRTGTASTFEAALLQAEQSAGSLDRDVSIALNRIDVQLASIGARYEEVFAQLAQDENVKVLVRQFAAFAKSGAEVLDVIEPLVPLLIQLGAIKLGASVFRNFGQFTKNLRDTAGGGAGLDPGGLFATTADRGLATYRNLHKEQVTLTKKAQKTQVDLNRQAQESLVRQKERQLTIAERTQAREKQLVEDRASAEVRATERAAAAKERAQREEVAAIQRAQEVQKDIENQRTRGIRNQAERLNSGIASAVDKDGFDKKVVENLRKNATVRQDVIREIAIQREKDRLFQSNYARLTRGKIQKDVLRTGEGVLGSFPGAKDPLSPASQKEVDKRLDEAITKAATNKVNKLQEQLGSAFGADISVSDQDLLRFAPEKAISQAYNGARRQMSREVTNALNTELTTVQKDIKRGLGVVDSREIQLTSENAKQFLAGLERFKQVEAEVQGLENVLKESRQRLEEGKINPQFVRDVEQEYQQQKLVLQDIEVALEQLRANLIKGNTAAAQLGNITGVNEARKEQQKVNKQISQRIAREQLETVRQERQRIASSTTNLDRNRLRASGSRFLTTGDASQLNRAFEKELRNISGAVEIEALNDQIRHVETEMKNTVSAIGRYSDSFAKNPPTRELLNEQEALISQHTVLRNELFYLRDQQYKLGSEYGRMSLAGQQFVKNLNTNSQRLNNIMTKFQNDLGEIRFAGRIVDPSQFFRTPTRGTRGLSTQNRIDQIFQRQQEINRRRQELGIDPIRTRIGRSQTSLGFRASELLQRGRDTISQSGRDMATIGGELVAIGVAMSYFNKEVEKAIDKQQEFFTETGRLIDNFNEQIAVVGDIESARQRQIGGSTGAIAGVFGGQMIGQTIGDFAAKKSGQVFGGAVGGVLGSVAPGVGTAIGIAVGTAAGGLIGAAITDSFNNSEFNAKMDALTDALNNVNNTKDAATVIEGLVNTLDEQFQFDGTRESLGLRVQNAQLQNPNPYGLMPVGNAFLDITTFENELQKVIESGDLDDFSKTLIEEIGNRQQQLLMQQLSMEESREKAIKSINDEIISHIASIQDQKYALDVVNAVLSNNKEELEETGKVAQRNVNRLAEFRKSINDFTSTFNLLRRNFTRATDEIVRTNNRLADAQRFGATAIDVALGRDIYITIPSNAGQQIATELEKSITNIFDTLDVVPDASRMFSLTSRIRTQLSQSLPTGVRDADQRFLQDVISLKAGFINAARQVEGFLEGVDLPEEGESISNITTNIIEGRVKELIGANTNAVSEEGVRLVERLTKSMTEAIVTGDLSQAEATIRSQLQDFDFSQILGDRLSAIFEKTNQRIRALTETAERTLDLRQRFSSRNQRVRRNIIDRIENPFNNAFDDTFQRINQALSDIGGASIDNVRQFASELVNAQTRVQVVQAAYKNLLAKGNQEAVLSINEAIVNEKSARMRYQEEVARLQDATAILNKGLNLLAESINSTTEQLIKTGSQTPKEFIEATRQFQVFQALSQGILQQLNAAGIRNVQDFQNANRQIQAQLVQAASSLGMFPGFFRSLEGADAFSGLQMQGGLGQTVGDTAEVLRALIASSRITNLPGGQATIDQLDRNIQDAKSIFDTMTKIEDYQVHALDSIDNNVAEILRVAIQSNPALSNDQRSRALSEITRTPLTTTFSAPNEQRDLPIPVSSRMRPTEEIRSTNVPREQLRSERDDQRSTRSIIEVLDKLSKRLDSLSSAQQQTDVAKAVQMFAKEIKDNIVSNNGRYNPSETSIKIDGQIDLRGLSVSSQGVAALAAMKAFAQSLMSKMNRSDASEVSFINKLELLIKEIDSEIRSTQGGN